MSLRQGMSQVMAAADKSKSRGSGSNIGTINFLYWTSGETKTIRFLSDANEIFVVKVHERVPDNVGKKRTFLCKTEIGETCPLCAQQYRPRELGYAIAVLREEIVEEVDGRRTVTGFKDFTYEAEVEENGKKVKKLRPYVGVVNQAPKNFWTYINAVYEKYGSLKEYDLEIKRQGGDTTTQYIPFPGPRVVIENIEERYKKFIPDLEAYLKYLGSDTYYNRYLGTGEGAVETEEEIAEEPFPAAVSELDEETEFERLKKQQASIAESASGGDYA
jgi:hypothetical protein